MDLDFYFWTGTPELWRVKKTYKDCVDKSNSNYKKGCKDIADQIAIDKDFSLESNFEKPKSFDKNCLLAYCSSNFSIITGLARFKKNKSYIYIDNLTGFNGAGKSLLEFILHKALRIYDYTYVEIEAASQDRNLAEYYKSIGDSMSHIQANITDNNHVKFTYKE